MCRAYVKLQVPYINHYFHDWLGEQKQVCGLLHLRNRF